LHTLSLRLIHQHPSLHVHLTLPLLLLRFCLLHHEPIGRRAFCTCFIRPPMARQPDTAHVFASRVASLAASLKRRCRTFEFLASSLVRRYPSAPISLSAALDVPAPILARAIG
jgi:hypothetical protein